MREEKLAGLDLEGFTKKKLMVYAEKIEMKKYIDHISCSC